MQNRSAVQKISYILVLIIIEVILIACGNGEESLPTTSPRTATLTPSPTLTSTSVPPSPTPVQLAARVNHDEITLERYQAELSRYQSAAGMLLATEDKQHLLNDMIDTLLLVQAAEEADFYVDESMLQERLDNLIEQLGNAQNLESWIIDQGYNSGTFREELKISIAAAWMRDQIITGVADKAEQVHARQILLYNFDQAQEVIDQLVAGVDFITLAEEYDPVTKGDLGWFPRGYLLYPALDEVAFSLDTGEYSQIIETSAGFHILQVIEHDPEHSLKPDALLVLQSIALQEWLEDRRSQSDIQVLLP